MHDLGDFGGWWMVSVWLWAAFRWARLHTARNRSIFSAAIAR